MKELHRFGDDVLNSPAPGIITNEQIQGCVEVVSDEEGGFLAAIPTNDDLTKLAFIVLQRNGGDVDERVGDLAFLVRDVNAFPVVELVDSPNHPAAATPNGAP